MRPHGPGLRILVFEFMRLETRAEMAPIGLEAFVGHHLVGFEAQADQRKVFAFEAPLGAGDLVIGDIDGAAIALQHRHRHGGLRQHRRHDRRLRHHGQRIAAGEAHADRADALAAAFAMHLLRQRPQPIDDGARFAAAPDLELARDAHVLEHLAQRIAGRDGPPRLAEQAGQEHGHARFGHPVGKADHLRMQAGNFMDDDDGRPGPAPIHIAAPAPVIEGEFGVVLERGAIVHRMPPCRSGPSLS